jgi:hypothetical protein
MTVSTQQRAGFAARFYSMYPDGVEAVRRVNRRHAVQARRTVFMICPVDTKFMRNHIRVRFLNSDLGWEIGWEEEDFIREGKRFYVIYVLFGTSKMPARDVLFAGTAQVRASYRSDISIELRNLQRRRRAR